MALWFGWPFAPIAPVTPVAPAHLAVARLKALTGTQIEVVPDKGLGPALTDTLCGDIHMTVTQALIKPHFKSGKEGALSVTRTICTAFTPH
ncbi:MAG: tripartite tricarboxylate transporter substrate-binding protein [Betaproteobacteria bacterium]